MYYQSLSSYAQMAISDLQSQNQTEQAKYLVQEIRKALKKSFCLCLSSQIINTIVLPNGCQRFDWIGLAAIIERQEWIYIGNLRYGKIFGRGTLTFSNEYKFKGEFVNGSFHGRGIYSFQNYNFNGQWINGIPKQGNLHINQQIYHIDFVRWNQNKVIIRFPNGDKYDGTYLLQNNQYYLNGHGTMTFSNGCKYVGNWNKSQISGLGTYTWPNQESYKGSFINGKKSGQGEYFSASKKLCLDCLWNNGRPVDGSAQLIINGQRHKIHIQNGIPETILQSNISLS